MLDPRLVALQGLGVPFTPIYAAVQGLIALIQEEARRDELHGGGKKRAAAQRGRWTAKPVGRQAGKVGADVSEAEVRAQWEALEARQQDQARSRPSPTTAKPAAQPKPPAAPVITAPQPAGPAQAVPGVAAVPLDGDDDEALVLILAHL